ncbi:lipase [Actinocatenispora rupis]|uniref:lipase n=1 Tax=Actinocatenispora rupis TaxID=519421 RepID=UPI001945319A|nr:lipase [Actinocatenispora rupis]
MTRTKRTVGAVAAAAVLAAAVPVAAPAYASSAQRGTVVSVRHLTGMSADQTRTSLRTNGFDASAVRRGVDEYQVVYRTVDPRHRPTTASGLLVLPRGGDRSLRTVSFAHGTESFRPDVPSTNTEPFVTSPPVTYAAAGFAAVAPDYLGMGEGPGTHPWMDVPSETTASLDLLRAARDVAARHGRTLRRDVLATGFSQGASAALGLGRALRGGADDWFRLTALAPVSGAYDFSGVELPAILSSGDDKTTVAYTTYLLVSWNRLHHLYRDPADIFRAPYAGRVDALFDGDTPGNVMLDQLPDSLRELLTDKGFALLRHPSPRFAAALRVADAVCDWHPGVPTRLYRATGDEQVPTVNTDRCTTAFAAYGEHPTVVELGTPEYEGSRHLGSAVAATAATVRWFASLR